MCKDQKRLSSSYTKANATNYTYKGLTKKSILTYLKYRLPAFWMDRSKSLHNGIRINKCEVFCLRQNLQLCRHLWAFARAILDGQWGLRPNVYCERLIDMLPVFRWVIIAKACENETLEYWRVSIVFSFGCSCLDLDVQMYINWLLTATALGLHPHFTSIKFYVKRSSL